MDVEEGDAEERGQGGGGGGNKGEGDDREEASLLNGCSHTRVDDGRREDDGLNALGGCKHIE